MHNSRTYMRCEREITKLKSLWDAKCKDWFSRWFLNDCLVFFHFSIEFAELGVVGGSVSMSFPDRLMSRKESAIILVVDYEDTH